MQFLTQNRPQPGEKNPYKKIHTTPKKQTKIQDWSNLFKQSEHSLDISVTEYEGWGDLPQPHHKKKFA